MLIVDAQIHIWTATSRPIRNHRQVIDFTAEDVLKEMDDAGVDAAVIHPPGVGSELQRSWPSRRRASTPTGSRSSAISPSTSRRAGR